MIRLQLESAAWMDQRSLCEIYQAHECIRVIILLFPAYLPLLGAAIMLGHG